MAEVTLTLAEALNRPKEGEALTSEPARGRSACRL
jgi:hypothetical protein